MKINLRNTRRRLEAIDQRPAPVGTDPAKWRAKMSTLKSGLQRMLRLGATGHAEIADSLTSPPPSVIQKQPATEAATEAATGLHGINRVAAAFSRKNSDRPLRQTRPASKEETGLAKVAAAFKGRTSGRTVARPKPTQPAGELYGLARVTEYFRRQRMAHRQA